MVRKHDKIFIIYLQMSRVGLMVSPTFPMMTLVWEPAAPTGPAGMESIRQLSIR